MTAAAHNTLAHREERGMVSDQPGGLSDDVKWIIGVTIVAVIAIGIAAVVVSVPALQFSGIAADMRSHEDRVTALNSEVIQEIRRLVEVMRDDDRELMYGVEELLRELRQIRQNPAGGDESAATRDDDLERALSSIEQNLTAWMLFRPVRTGYVTQRLDDVLKELQAIKERLEADQPPEAASDQPPEAASDQPARGGRRPAARIGGAFLTRTCATWVHSSTGWQPEESRYQKASTPHVGDCPVDR